MIDKVLFINNAAEAEAREEGWQEIFDYMEGLKAQGWRRVYVWNLLDTLLRVKGLQDEVMDVLDNYNTSLDGRCADNNVERFPGDPEGEKKLAWYVGTGTWREE